MEELEVTDDTDNEDPLFVEDDDVAGGGVTVVDALLVDPPLRVVVGVTVAVTVEVVVTVDVTEYVTVVGAFVTSIVTSKSIMTVG